MKYVREKRVKITGVLVRCILDCIGNDVTQEHSIKHSNVLNFRSEAFWLIKTIFVLLFTEDAAECLRSSYLNKKTKLL